MQVVRYHSLVVDPESLPKELIPIAWTSSTTALSFLGTQKSDVTSDGYGSPLCEQISINSSSRKSKNGSSWPSIDSEMQSEKVLMGIMHSTRPHYGLQVCFSHCTRNNRNILLCVAHLLSFVLRFSFILKVLQPVMGGKYSRTLEKSLRIIGSTSDHPPLLREKFIVVVNYFFYNSWS